jgi:hypothetical protein
MRFVQANPNEYLVVARRGRINSRGVAGSAFLWPGSTYVRIPSTQQEAAFEMTQESRDSIPLRFKGIVIYRIVDPETAARRFDFTAPGGLEQINTLISHICLGELRAAVAHLSMNQCIEQRKTTLTDAVAGALQQVIHGKNGEPGWGIELDVVQVAQVFIVDQELRKQLEAELRNAIRVKSVLSDIQTREGIKLAETTSERRLAQESLGTEREKMDITREKVRLQQQLEHDQIQAEAPNKLLRIAKHEEVLRKQLETLPMEIQARELQARAETVTDRVRQELRRDILPLEQAPAIAEALSRMLNGMNLSIYGQESTLTSSIAPLIDLLASRVRSSLQPLPAEGKSAG